MTYRERNRSIVERATISDVLRLAGRPQPDRRGRICCPVHDDDHPSLKVQPSGRGVRCHACGWRGGVLDFAVALGLGRDRAGAALEVERRIGR